MNGISTTRRKTHCGAIPLAVVSFVAALSVTGADAAPYLVTERFAGRIWRLEDNNGDGDALDPGERSLWGDGLSNVVEMLGDFSNVYVVEEGLPGGQNKLFRMRDLNHDGDALDAGEAVIFADGLTEPRGVAQRGGREWFISDIVEDRVWRAMDHNNDGDVLDAGERALYAVGIDGATSLLARKMDLLATAFSGDQLHRLVDINGDGDALDVGENVPFTSTIDQPLGLLAGDDGSFFVSSRSADAVFRLHDRNGDGDMLDVAEVLRYADSVYGGVNGPWGMTNFDDGGFLLADYLDGEILRVEDRNGDGDALDVAEVRRFADGIANPVSIIRLSPDPIPGDTFPLDGVVNIDDLNAVRNNFGASDPWMDAIPGDTYPFDGVVNIDDLNAVRNNFGATAAQVPEPAGVGLAMVCVTTLIFQARGGRGTRRKR